MVAQELVVAWEDAYRRYESAEGDDVTEASWAVAGAWHNLAACAELPWWLSAAVRSAAQAFEHQAKAWAADGEDDDRAAVHPNDEDEEEDDDETHVAYGTVALPAQQRNRISCACADTPPAAGPPAAAVSAVRVTA